MNLSIRSKSVADGIKFYLNLRFCKDKFHHYRILLFHGIFNTEPKHQPQES
jgi:hypothetical protein